MQTRNPGYYWVKYPNKEDYNIEYWNGGMWFTRNPILINDKDFEDINENQILRDSKSTDLSKITDKDILSNALIFTIGQIEQGDSMESEKFTKIKSTFYNCIKWFRDNYKPKCDGFLGEYEGKI